MKKYLNVNDGTVSTEEEINANHGSNFEELSEKWKEEGFYNRDEYVKWLNESFIKSDYVEVQPYLIHPGMLGPVATNEDVKKVIDWFKRQDIECELTENFGSSNEYSQKPDADLWKMMLEDVFGIK